MGVFLTRSICRPLEAAVRRLHAMVEQSVSASSQISLSSQSLAQGASTQAASVEEAGSSLVEMSAMTSRNAEAAAATKQAAGRARLVVESGAATIHQMAASLEGIRNSNSEIAQIIRTIDELAFQTNLLALNAAVEAARAGEAGAGFAIVAEEVRTLAQRSAHAAKESADKIAAAQRNGETGVQAGHEEGAGRGPCREQGHTARVGQD